MAEKKFSTTSGIEIKEVYTQPSKMDELPGEFPFARGIQKDMYRGKAWTMRQYAGFSTPKNQTNVIITCWGKAQPVYPLPLTCPPK